MPLNDGYRRAPHGLGTYKLPRFGQEAGVSLRGPGHLRGRQGVDVPTGFVLPEAKGGLAPYTYSVEDLPAGITFTAATRALTGSPNAAGEHTVTYKVEDSTTPVALEKSVTFAWDNLGLLSADAIMLQDFDGGKVGYGVSDFEFAYAATLVSGANPGFGNTQVWASAPRTVIGSVVDDPYAKRLLPTGAIISRIDHRASDNPDRFRFFDSNQDLDGNAVDSDVGAWAQANPGLSLYLQRALNAPGVTLAFMDDIDSVGNWNVTFEVTAAQSTWIRNNLADDDQFLLVIA